MFLSLTAQFCRVHKATCKSELGEEPQMKIGVALWLLAGPSWWIYIYIHLSRYTRMAPPQRHKSNILPKWFQLIFSESLRGYDMVWYTPICMYIYIYYIILYYIILYYIILYYYYIILHYIILYFIILYYIILHYIILYYIILYYIILYILYYIIYILYYI